MALRSAVKEWKLVQGLLLCGVVAFGAGAYFLGRFDPAAFLRVEEPRPETELMLYGQMRDAVERGDWPRALALAERLRKARPDDGEAERVRAAALLEVRRYPEAQDAFQVWIAGHPNDIAARLGLASARNALGEEEAARQTLRAVLAHPLATPAQREAARLQLFATDAIQDARAGAPTPNRSTITAPPGEPPWMRPLPPLDRKALGLPPAKK